PIRPAPPMTTIFMLIFLDFPGRRRPGHDGEDGRGRAGKPCRRLELPFNSHWIVVQAERLCFSYSKIFAWMLSGAS
ncbi:MAG: hypothetical protein E6614_37975, partial [Bradyrhizobium sp.]|nr:hypothetical protein [Bradyrhizobium sp.]